MADTLNIGINVVAGPAKKALNETAKATDEVAESLGRAQKSADKVGNQFNKTGVKLNKFGKGVAQQVGYQVADFSVQLTGGTNALQAFGQQGSQMLAVFGPIGSLLGAAVAILAAVGVTAQKSGMFMLGAGEQSEKAARSIEELGKSVSTLDGILDTSLSSSLKTLEEDFGGFNQNVIDATTNLRQLALETAQINLGKGATETLKAMSDLEDKSSRLQLVLRGLRETSGLSPENQLAGIKKFGFETKEQAKEFIDQQQRMGRAFAALRESVTVDQFTALGKELSILAGMYPEQRSLLIALANESLKMAKALSGPQVEAYKSASDSAKEYTDTLDQLRKEQAKALEKEGDERARQAVKLASGEVQAAQAAARAREREAAAREADQNARAREAQAIFEAEQRRVKSIEKAYSASLASINKETQALKLQNELFGQSEAAIKAQVDFLAVTAALKEKGKNFTLEELDAIHAQLKARAEEAGMLEHKKEEQRLQEEREKATNSALKKINEERERAQRRINQLIGDGFRTAGDAIAGLITGTNTWREALTQVLRKVIDIASQMGTTKSGGFSFDKLFGAVGGLFRAGPSFSPVSLAGPIGAGGVQTFHTGGIVGRGSGPTGPRSDERLIMARTGERVLNRGETMGSAGGGGVVVNQTINLSTGVQQTVRAEVMSLAPQIAAQAKAAVLDAKKRGGGFGAAFA